VLNTLKVLLDLFLWAWWCTPVIPVFRRLRQEDGEFQASLGSIVRPFLKINNNKSFLHPLPQQYYQLGVD
jgi:hypothetical protein